MKEQVKRFLALAPLLLPSLIRENKLVGEEITEDVSILHFNLDEELPITYVMDMLEDDMELSLLYYARATTQNSQCCYFTPPSSRDMYKFYAEADKIPSVYRGLGIAIVSTPNGLLTDKQARKAHVGGEILAYVW